jgi:hypothetical protein
MKSYRVHLNSGREISAPTLLKAEQEAQRLGGGRVYCTCHPGFLMSTVFPNKLVDKTPGTGLERT